MRWAALLTLAVVALASDPYVESIETWRRDREARLKADDGWLTVSGLFWLKEGRNAFGADPSNDIVFPQGSAPAKAGVLEHREGRTVLRLFQNDGPGREIRMKADSEGEPTVIQLADLSFFVIKRDNRYALRLRDKNSPYRQKFTGVESFPIDPNYRLEARFVPYNPPKKVLVPSIIGYQEEYVSPGYAEFELGGRACRLEPVSEGGPLFFIFKDLTSGKTTYPAGRFLYADPPQNGRVIVDFNKAYNPPCAFTPYATCPLPPKQNRLPVAVEAGEKAYHLE
ncbi:MAG: DUF1684 domain-containing protein [Bryobacteraceae bacterium]|nr:DUF1684 domain-containing protein [Bryobacteraceae bacterium]